MRPDPWSPERVVDVHLSRALVEAQFPDLADARIEPLGVGWDNTAFLVGDAWVFRFPRRQVAVACMEQEIRVLPGIAPDLPLPIPVPSRFGRGEGRFPWPFAGYRRLSGRTACAAALDDAQRTEAAESIARFLAVLHSIPAAKAVALGARGDEIGRLDVVRRTATALAALAELRRLEILDANDLVALEAALESADSGESGRSPSLVHGDLYSRHILVDDRSAPSGVIDWGDVHLGNPAVDLAIAFTFLPSRAHGAFRRAYGPIDDATWRLARFRAVDHSAALARYAHGVGDVDALRESRLALRGIAAG